ncbi:hypothetical protein VNI00_013532 [Paramarasmius palmivorus]|uniref:Uncharacterized protein n=1 Tax=Paramarasmius palmivorus TaxID=297713 RepID=A0AAW0BWI3_9AGAR
MDHLEEKGDLNEQLREDELAEVDLATFHEREAGRLILDPAEARIEFGERFASRLKLTEDGKTILWPQPTDDPADPQNPPIVPDFESAIGIASVFELAETYNTTTEHINNLTSNWSVFLVGWGGFFGYVPWFLYLCDERLSGAFWMLMRKYGRLPVLFWSQLLALGFLIGATFAPTLEIFAGKPSAMMPQA